MAFLFVASLVNLGAGSAVVAAAEAKPPAAAPPTPNPFAVHTLSPTDQFVFEGRVEERLEAGPYVYQRVDGRWVVSLALTTPHASRVRVTAVGQAERFVSPRLGRTFDSLVFGMVRSAPQPNQEGNQP